jgi:hypothetical protein
MLAGMQAAGVDAEALLDTYIRAYNACLKGRPRDMTVGLHLCRGNFKDGLHFSEGGYDRIARKLFNEIDVDTYYLEYDTQRAGSFEPLRHLPPHKSVVLGVLSSKLPALEHVEHVKQRIHEAAETIAGGELKRSKEEALNQFVALLRACRTVADDLQDLLEPTVRVREPLGGQPGDVAGHGAQAAAGGRDLPGDLVISPGGSQDRKCMNRNAKCRSSIEQ